MPSQPLWASPRNVALLIAGYLLVHLGVRLWMGPTLGFDDAEQALFAQHWLPSYRLRGPPLFTWALLAIGPVAGFGVVAISLLRYALLAMVLGFTWATARRLIRDPTLAALAAFSFTAIYVFGYYSHHDLTHTTVLSAFLAASWYVFVRLSETPRLGWYLALGLCFGLGMLGKWNFAIFAVALPLACLVHPGYRALVLTWKIVPAALLATAIALPPALWILSMGASQGDGIGEVLGQQSGSLLNLLKGTASLALAVLAYPLPFLAIFLAVFGAAAWAGLRRTESAPQTADYSRIKSGVIRPTGAVPDVRLIGTVMAIAVGLHWLLVPIAGATQFPERLMQPALIILPVWLFMLVERSGRPYARGASIYALVLAVVAGVALAVRVGVHAAGGCRRVCRDLLPAADLAAGLRAAGFRGKGTIVVPDMHLGGNLRVQFPEARVVDIGYPPRVWPGPAGGPPGTGQCLAVWTQHGGPVEKSGDRMYAYLGKELGVAGDARKREGAVTATLLRARTRTYRLQYGIYDGPEGECR
jgi:4-amino-4-deoxy-L-arabinose transferase-like glycosyltransferase